MSAGSFGGSIHRVVVVTYACINDSTPTSTSNLGSADILAVSSQILTSPERNLQVVLAMILEAHVE